MMYNKVKTKALELYLDQFVQERATFGVAPTCYRDGGFSYEEYIQACNILNYFKGVWFKEGTMNLDTFLDYLFDSEDQLSFYEQCDDIQLLESVLMDCQEFMIEKMSDMSLVVNDRFYKEEFEWTAS